MRNLLSILVIMLVVVTGAPLSQAADASPETTASPTTTNSPSESPEVSASPTTSPDTTPSTEFNFFTKSIVLTKFRRFFTRDPQKRGELTAAITNALLLKVQEEQVAGETEKAEGTLVKYERESDYLQIIVDELGQHTKSPRVLSFLDLVVVDKTTQLETLQAVHPQAASELAKKITNARAKALKEVVKILENTELSEEEREKKLEKVVQQYARREAKIDSKIARKLTLKKDLDENSGSEDLKQDLGEQEDVILDDSRTLATPEVETLLSSLESSQSEEHLLVILEKLLERVPAEARPKVEAAFARILEKKVGELEADPDKVDTFLENRKNSARAREAILKRIKDKSGKSEVKTRVDEEIKSGGEKVETEKRRESERKGSSGASSSGSASTPPPVPSSSPSATAPVKETSIIIRIRGGRFEDTSFTVEKGSKVSIRFENSDSTPHSLSISNGYTSSPISEGERATLSGFIIDGPLTFSSSVGRGTISVK